VAQHNVFTVIILLILVGTLAAADPLDDVRAKFCYLGTAIHPGIIQLFDPGLADLKPQVLEIDLAAAQPSNRFSADTYSTDPTGWVRLKHSDPEDQSGFGYKFIGRLPSGTLVVETEDEGGGSGIFETVMLFSVRAETGLSDDGSPRVEHVLHILREVPLGDRAGAALRIDGTHVLIDRSQAKDVEMKTPMVLNDPLPVPGATGTGHP
jgi:hypothetical protein